MNSNFKASPARSLKAKNTHGMAKFVGLNLTRKFFFILEIFLSKNCPPIVCLLVFCRLSYTSKNCFFFNWQFSIKLLLLLRINHVIVI